MKPPLSESALDVYEDVLPRCTRDETPFRIMRYEIAMGRIAYQSLPLDKRFNMLYDIKIFCHKL
jgi:hypothetical protein